MDWFPGGPTDLLAQAKVLMDTFGLGVFVAAVLIIAVVGAFYDRFFNKG